MSQLNDPAIIDSSILSMSDNGKHNGSSSSLATYQTAIEQSSANGASTTLGSLEPGNALTKLLDSAVANAAKELTPEPDSSKGTSQLALPRRPSMLDFKPATSKMYVYSIDELFNLRTSPDVGLFDTCVLPDSAFWVIRAPNKKSQEKNGSGSSRNRRRGQSQNQQQQHQSDAAGKWERKPTGFAKSAELDKMSAEKISQLLGENPEEGTPEWDTPGAAELQMDMGSTVEDFERWKQRMRQNDRSHSQHGEVETSLAAEQETPKGNEVDNFFSFVKPKANASQEASTPGSETGKTSRFSSFFGGPGPEQSPKRSAPPPGLASRAPMGKGSDSSGLRFFSMAQGSSSQNLTPTQERAGLAGPPPPPPQAQLPQQSPLPSGGQGMPPGLGPAGGDKDSFFLSLMNKRDQGLPQTDKSGENEKTSGPSIPGFAQGASFAPPQGGPQSGLQGPRQGIPPWMNNPQMGGPPPPGFQRGPQHMYQFQGPPPPGMFPPGMPPPQGMPPQGYPRMQGQPQGGQGQMPNGALPGFYGFPPGMGPPGMPPQQQHQQSPLQQQQQPIEQQQQQQQQQRPQQ